MQTAELTLLRDQIRLMQLQFEGMAEQQQHFRETIERQQQRIHELEARPVASVTNNNIVINNFGHEDVSFLDAETLKKRFLDKSMGIIQTIKDVHMNDAKPENRNVRMKSRKRNLAERFVSGQWEQDHASAVVDDLIYNGYRINSSVYLTDNAFAEQVQSDPLFDGYVRWMTDIMGVRLAQGGKKEHVVRTRQQVRSLLLRR